MTAKELAEQLAAIADSAKRLREEGVLGRVTVDGVSFEVCEVAAPTGQAIDAPVSANPLDDADLYGGFIPQRRRPRDEAPQATADEDD